jgi:hypothetical protein
VKYRKPWTQLVRQQMETSFDVISIHREAAAADPLVAGRVACGLVHPAR